MRCVKDKVVWVECFVGGVFSLVKLKKVMYDIIKKKEIGVFDLILLCIVLNEVINDNFK